MSDVAQGTNDIICAMSDVAQGTNDNICRTFVIIRARSKTKIPG